MTSSRVRILVLVALLAAWVLIFGLRSPGRHAAAPAAAGPAVQAVSARTVPQLKRELIDLPRATYPAEVHNIFGAPPPPPRPPMAALPTGGPAPPGMPPPPPPDPFVEEAKQFRFVGYLKSAASMTAFITRGQEIHTLGPCEVLLGRYRVQAVSEDDVVLTSPQGDKQVRLPFVPTSGQPAHAQQLPPTAGPVPQRPRPFGPPEGGGIPGSPVGVPPGVGPGGPVPGAR